MSTLTFRYRELRQQRITDALVALPEANLMEHVRHAIRVELTAQQTTLAPADGRTSDRAFLAHTEDWLWDTAPPLGPKVRDDLVVIPLVVDAAITDAQLAAVEALPRGPGPRPDNFLDQVRAALGDDEVAFTDLVHTAYRLHLQNGYPFDDVGVLLPLRLETLFDAPNTPENPDFAQWKLSLRVVPDEASIRRDNKNVSDGERLALIDFWNAAAPKPLARPFVTQTWFDSDKGKTAWANFCAKSNPARAAWLTSAFQPELNAAGDGLTVTVPPAQLNNTPKPNCVGGLPPRLGVWVVTNDDKQLAVGSLPMDPQQHINNDALTLPLPNTLAGQNDARESWWASWKTAQAVGLGGEWLLPAGVTPQTIAALYVVGIGDEAPVEHFRAQSEGGELGALQLGAPTNAVHGAAAANLATDAEAWRNVAQTRITERTAPPTTRLAHFLVGDNGAIPTWPGAAWPDDTEISQRLVQALWPALWGNWLREVWRVGDDANRVATWAFKHLCPEGPLAPIRINEQPYGLLPVTSLWNWQPGGVGEDGRDPQQLELEQRMAETLAGLRRQWATAARKTGTVVGKNASGFIELLGRDALSQRYITRNVVDPIAGVLAHGLVDAARDEFLERAQKMYQAALNIMPQRPVVHLLAMGHVQTRTLPLVLPWRMTYRATPNGDDPQRVSLLQLLEQMLAGVSIERLFENMEHQDWQWHVLPNSLLVRLLVYACQLAATWQAPPFAETAREMLEHQMKAAFNIADDWYDRPDWWDTDKHPRTGQPRFLVRMPEVERLRLERAFRATLDTATHRIDPWVTGFAWQRLKQYSASPRRAYRLGAYGWVDGPILGKPGPTDAGRLHAPSYGQALASLVLRDKYLSSQRELANPASRNPWHMDIDSRKVRLAQDLADEVRLGFNIHEILGRRVEHILGAHQKIKELRTSERYAMRQERKDPNEVCDGVRALRGLLTGDPEGIVTAEHLQLDQPNLPPGDRQFPLSDDQRLNLKLLHLALDTYGDLLMTDGVMQLTHRQAERAAETMDAASGFSRPPTLEFIRTPPSGYLLETRVLTVLPYVSVRNVSQSDSPYRIAEPSLISFIQNRLGAAWVWDVVDGAGVTQTITLADLGLSMADTLALSEEMLSDWACAKAGVAVGKGAVTAPPQHRLARQLCTVLGNRPAAGRDFANDATKYKTQDATIYAELMDRYRKLYKACKALMAQFAAATTDDDYADVIRGALRWGITPIANPQDKRALLTLLVDGEPPTDATPLAVLAAIVYAVLQARFKASPALDALPATVDGLASAISALATPDGKLSILARWERTQLTAQTGLKTKQLETTLEEAWLTTVATVRPALARFEALQLEARLLNAFAPLDAWTCLPGDAWQTSVVQSNLNAREGATPLEIKHPKFVAAFGSAQTWQGTRVAVAVLDSFSEAIPMPQRTTTVAFGFNAPAARAPQAILLAVPPAPRQRLDEGVLLQTLIETRELAHARAARLEDLGELQSLAPAMGLRTSGSPRVRLERIPLYE